MPGPLPGPPPRGPPPTARQVLIRLLQKTPKQGGELPPPPQQQMMTGATSKAEARCRMRGSRSNGAQAVEAGCGDESQHGPSTGGSTSSSMGIKEQLQLGQQMMMWK